MATREYLNSLDELPPRTQPDGGHLRAWMGSAYGRTRVRAVAQVVDALAERWPERWSDLLGATWTEGPRSPDRSTLEGHEQLRHLNAKAVSFHCPALGTSRQVWLYPRSSPRSSWTAVALQGVPRQTLPCALHAELPFLTGRFDRVERFTARIATTDEHRALLSALEALQSHDPETWGGLSGLSWTPDRCGSPELHKGLSAVGLPHRLRQSWLRSLGLRYLDPEQRAWTVSPYEWRSRELWPSILLRRIWTVRMPDAQTLVIAVVTRPRAVPGRSPLGLVKQEYQGPPQVGLGWWCDAQRWRQQPAYNWSVWEPAAVPTRGSVLWLCPSPPPGAGLMPEARLCQGRADARMRRVRVSGDTSDYVAHRAAVLAVARAEARQYGAEPMEEDRLEGIRVPWRLFREVYDQADREPVYGRSDRKRRPRWSDTHWPRPRKPGMVFRWSGLWNSWWWHGYEYWGCHVWSLEWREEGRDREIHVLVDVQTD